jgi:DNA-binding FadR family transcriptional regulator
MPPAKSRKGTGFSRLSVVSRSKQVQDQLSGAILRGDFAPGERLPSERELTDSFGVSRVSVREALKSLEALGLVEVHHGNGCFVTDPATRQTANLGRWLDIYREDLRDLIGVRGVLDAYAAEQAALSAAPAALEEVQTAATAFDEMADAGAPSVDRLSELDREFHTSIGRATGNGLLAALLEALHNHLAGSRRLWLEDKAWRQSSAREHAAIVGAIEAEDPTAAREAVAAHMKSVNRMLDEYGTASRATGAGAQRARA